MFETIVFNNTAANTPEFTGNKYIKQIMFYKSQYSAPEDYDIDVLEGLKNRGVIEDYKFEKQSQIFIKQTSQSDFV